VISVSFAAQPPTTLVVSTTLSLTALVNNDSKGAGVNWTVTCGSASCGSFNPASTASSQATTYTAPAAIPTGNTVTLTATSVTDSTKSVVATVTITAVAPAVLSDGTYVFRLSGEDISNGGSPYFVAGAFTVANKNISGGEQDFVDQVSGITDNILASGSSLSATGNGNIQIVLNTGDNNVGVTVWKRCAARWFPVPVYYSQSSMASLPLLELSTFKPAKLLRLADTRSTSPASMEERRSAPWPLAEFSTLTGPPSTQGPAFSTSTITAEWANHSVFCWYRDCARRLWTHHHQLDSQYAGSAIWTEWLHCRHQPDPAR